MGTRCGTGQHSRTASGASTQRGSAISFRASRRSICAGSREMDGPASNPEGHSLAKLLWLIGATVGGWIGWWLGDRFGLFVAVVLSAVGTGVGIYAARRIVAEHF